MRIAVVDGQGGGMGRLLVERLRLRLQNRVQIVALGTNVMATSAMLKAGADEGASGENAIVVNARRVDMILGSVGILSADAMMGELSPAMAKAIGQSDALKVLIPVNRCGIQVVGLQNLTLAQQIDEAVDAVLGRLTHEDV